jgi:hypothetical protein
VLHGQLNGGLSHRRQAAGQRQQVSGAPVLVLVGGARAGDGRWTLECVLCAVGGVEAGMAAACCYLWSQLKGPAVGCTARPLASTPIHARCTPSHPAKVQG